MLALVICAGLLVMQGGRTVFGQTSSDMSYYGGPVMHMSNTYAIFWLPSGYSYVDFPWTNSGYESLIERFLIDVGGTSYYNILTQYSDNTNGTILDISNFRGAYVDTTPYPVSNGSIITDSELQNEILSDMRTNGWSGGLDSVFFVFTAKGVNFAHFESGACAYHSYFYSNGNPVVWANMMDFMSLFNTGVSCSAGWNVLGLFSVTDTPNLSPYADAEINVLSHELFESVTDPLLNAWGTDEQEVADRCAWQFGTVSLTGSDITLNGHSYIVQEEWSNYGEQCVLSYGPSIRMTVNLEPSNGAKQAPFNVTYSTNGIMQWTSTTTGQSDIATFYADPNSQVVVSSINQPDERWCFSETCPAMLFVLGPCPSGSICSEYTSPLYYYDLLLETPTLNLRGGGNPSISLHFASAPSSVGNVDSQTAYNIALMPSQQDIWIERGTIASIPMSVGNGTERWETTSTNSWEASGPYVVTGATYFHQYQVTFEYSIIGVDSAFSSPTVGYSQGGSYQSTGVGVAVWADAGQPYVYPTTLDGSTNTEQWTLAPPTASTVTGPGTIGATYYHQYSFSVTYSYHGGTSQMPPTITATSLGKTQTVSLTQTSFSGFLDAGTQYQVSNPVAGPITGERWYTPSSQAGGTLDGPTTISLEFYHQFALTISYQINGGGNPTSPSISGITSGSQDSQSMSQQPTHVWLDAGSTYNITNPLVGSNSTDRWFVSPSSGVANAPFTSQVVYNHQFYVAVDVSPIGDGSVPGLSGWYDAGSILQLSATPSSGFMFGSWESSTSYLTATSPDLAVSSAVVNGPGILTASFTPAATSTSTSLSQRTQQTSSSPASTGFQSTTSQLTATESGTSPAMSGSGNNGIPDLPPNAIAIMVVTVLGVVGYLLVRRRL